MSFGHTSSYFLFNRNDFLSYANSADPDQSPQSAASLIWVCTVCLCVVYGTIGIYRLTHFICIKIFIALNAFNPGTL